MSLFIATVLMMPVYLMLIRAFIDKDYKWFLAIPFYIIFISFLLYQLDKIYPF